MSSRGYAPLSESDHERGARGAREVRARLRVRRFEGRGRSPRGAAIFVPLIASAHEAGGSPVIRRRLAMPFVPERIEGDVPRSVAALRAVCSWAISAVNAREGGAIPKIDPNIVIDVSTLKRVGKVVAVYSSRPLVSGAVILLELLARLLLLFIFLWRSPSPTARRTTEKMQGQLAAHVNAVRRCAAPAARSLPLPPLGLLPSRPPAARRTASIAARRIK